MYARCLRIVIKRKRDILPPEPLLNFKLVPVNFFPLQCLIGHPPRKKPVQVLVFLWLPLVEVFARVRRSVPLQSTHFEPAVVRTVCFLIVRCFGPALNNFSTRLEKGSHCDARIPSQNFKVPYTSLGPHRSPTYSCVILLYFHEPSSEIQIDGAGETRQNVGLKRNCSNTRETI